MSAVPIADTKPKSSPTITMLCSSSRRLTALTITSALRREKATAVVQYSRDTCEYREGDGRSFQW